MVLCMLSAEDRSRQALTLVGAVAQAALPLVLIPRFRFVEPPPDVISPAGWAVSVWLPIYAGSLAYAVDQARPGTRERELLREVGWPLAGAFLANGAWAPLVLRRRYWSAQAALLGIAGLAEVARRRLGRAAARGVPLTRPDTVALAPTVGMLAAWGAAASGVNLAAMLVAEGLVPRGWPAEVTGGAVLLGLGSSPYIAAARCRRGRRRDPRPQGAPRVLTAGVTVPLRTCCGRSASGMPRVDRP